MYVKVKGIDVSIICLNLCKNNDYNSYLKNTQNTFGVIIADVRNNAKWFDISKILYSHTEVFGTMKIIIYMSNLTMLLSLYQK